MLNRLTKLVVSVIYFVVNEIVHVVRSPLGQASDDTLVILSYHSVRPSQRGKFGKQMDQVLKTGKAVFADIGESSGEGNHHIAVTFDDGFKNVLDNALPETLSRKIPVIIFIPTGYIGTYPGWIKNPHHENVGEMLLSADELKGVPTDMVKIGSHGVTHPHLTSLGREQIIEELTSSKKQLELLLGREITALSFPYDNYDDDIVQLAREAGYLKLFADLPICPLSKLDAFLAGRISTTPDDWRIEFYLKLRGAYQWLPYAVRIKKIGKAALLGG